MKRAKTVLLTAMTFWFLALLASAQDVTFRAYAPDQTVTCTFAAWSGEMLGDQTQNINAADLNAGTYNMELSTSAGTINVDVRLKLTPGMVFEAGGNYVFQISDDGSGNVSSEFTEQPAPHPDDVSDWFWAGWNLGLGVMGFALVLRVVKGLRGPGSGEL